MTTLDEIATRRPPRRNKVDVHKQRLLGQLRIEFPAQGQTTQHR